MIDYEDSVIYFMTKMTQEEFTIKCSKFKIKPHPNYRFNLIKAVGKDRLGVAISSDNA